MRTKQKWYKNIHVLFFLAPAVIAAFILIVVPLFITIYYSFTNLDSNTMTYDRGNAAQTILEQTYYLNFCQDIHDTEKQFNQFLKNFSPQLAFTTENPVWKAIQLKENTKMANIQQIVDKYSTRPLFTKEFRDKTRKKIAREKSFGGNKLEQAFQDELKQLKSRRLESKLKTFQYQKDKNQRPFTIKHSYILKHQSQTVF